MARIPFPVCLSSGSFKGEGAVPIGFYTALGGSVQPKVPVLELVWWLTPVSPALHMWKNEEFKGQLHS